MLDDLQFRDHADASLTTLKKSLYEAENDADIEVEDQAGALQIAFEDGTRFVVSPNAPVRLTRMLVTDKAPTRRRVRPRPFA